MGGDETEQELPTPTNRKERRYQKKLNRASRKRRATASRKLATMDQKLA